MQSAGIQFIAAQLSPPLLSAVTPDSKSWQSVPDDQLAELSAAISTPACPLSPDQRQQALQALGRMQQGDQRAREARLREDAAELASAVGAHANATSHVAEVLQDLGYSISSSVESLKDTLHPFPKLTEYDVARFDGTHTHAPHAPSSVAIVVRFFSPFFFHTSAHSP